MALGALVERATARSAVEHWVEQLGALFADLARNAGASGWRAETEEVVIREDPFSLGAALEYRAPVLVLRRADARTGEEQRVTFEPRSRYTLGAAGRIDVYAFPTLREALLLRTPETQGAADLTWEQAEERVAVAPWRVFSEERRPLDADLGDPGRLAEFLGSLVD